MFEDLLGRSGFWSRPGPQCDVVLSTRIRLARNLASVSFPHQQDDNEKNLVRSIARRFARESSFNEALTLVEMGDLDPADRRFLRERNLITSQMESSGSSMALIGEDEDFVILVNEEDHFRIQVIKPGFQLMDAFTEADRLDDEMNRFVTYAYSDELGYLTTCPSNLGTALRASTMMHLPVLTMTRSIDDVTRMVRDFGADLRGTLGEGNKTIGSIYQVSNHVSLGKSEVDILEQLDEVTTMLIEMESESRDDYISQYGRQLEDRIWRSFGMMKYSRVLSYMDSMEHLANIRLGIILSVIKNLDLHAINDLMVNVQWSHLQKSARRSFADGLECDSYRADYLRSRFD